MATKASEILAGIRELEADLARELDSELREQRRLFHYRVEAGRVRFEAETRRLNKRLRESWLGYIFGCSLASLLVAPLIYSLIVPLALLDLWVQLYQAVCFPAYRVAKVRRRDYFVLDRRHLDYLNGIEKVNCTYCSYANGLVGFVREVSSRTEQYFCPIKHARAVGWTHTRMHRFFEYGDAAAYKLGAGLLRAELGSGYSARRREEPSTSALPRGRRAASS